MEMNDDMIIELHNTPGSQCRDDALMEITIQGGDDIVDRYNASAKTTRKKWWKNFSKHLKYGGDWVEENRGYIMVVATVITTITFQLAASPPGGVWSQSGNITDPSGGTIQVYAGTSVFGDTNATYYFFFMLFNAISFLASIIVTFLLISGFPVKNKFCMGLLTIALCTSLTFLVFSYIAAISLVTPFPTDTLKYRKYFRIPELGMTGLVAVISLVGLFHLTRFLVWLGRRIKMAIHKLNC